jgi:hypothetical protein
MRLLNRNNKMTIDIVIIKTHAIKMVFLYIKKLKPVIPIVNKTVLSFIMNVYTNYSKEGVKTKSLSNNLILLNFYQNYFNLYYNITYE